MYPAATPWRLLIADFIAAPELAALAALYHDCLLTESALLVARPRLGDPDRPYWIAHDPAFGPAHTILALTPLLRSALDAYLVAVSAPPHAADDRNEDDDLPSDDDIPF